MLPGYLGAGQHGWVEHAADGLPRGHEGRGHPGRGVRAEDQQLAVRADGAHRERRAAEDGTRAVQGTAEVARRIRGGHDRAELSALRRLSPIHAAVVMIADLN